MIKLRIFKNVEISWEDPMKMMFRFNAVLIILLLFLFQSCKDETPLPTQNLDESATVEKIALVPSTVFATGLDSPRGLKFGPDGYLYVAEAGTGGTDMTVGTCEQVVPPIGPYSSGMTGKVARIDMQGNVNTVLDNLPSAVSAMGDVVGPADVAFIHHNLFVLINAGCSHGVADIPSSIIKAHSNGTWNVMADLSNWQQNHPTAVNEEDDFEPDGTWYSMIEVRNQLYALEPNHGELVRVNGSGNISRVFDLSRSFGHIVPTALANRGDLFPFFYVGNLNTFPIQTGSSNIYLVTPWGQSIVTNRGFTTVLGIAFDKLKRMYVLESSAADGFPTPGAGMIVRVNFNGTRTIIANGLTFPTGMTFGPDGALYVSHKGYGFGAGEGEILKLNCYGSPLSYR